jgi:hypothetical protein
MGVKRELPLGPAAEIPGKTQVPRRSMDKSGIIARLRSLRSRGNVAGQRRFGITPGTEQFGIAIPVLRGLARAHPRDHGLALELWASGIHEARILAVYVDDPIRVSAGQMDAWARDFDSWDVCDQVCGNLFDRTPHAVAKAVSWSGRRAEFVRKAALLGAAPDRKAQSGAAQGRAGRGAPGSGGSTRGRPAGSQPTPCASSGAERSYLFCSPFEPRRLCSGAWAFLTDWPANP